MSAEAGVREERRWWPGERFGPSRIVTAAELMAQELPPVRWVVPGLLPEGVTLLAGKPKLGKSWLAYGLAVAVASGGVALGTKPVERGEVLYLALEDNPRRLQGRLKKMLAGGAAPKGLHIATEWPRMDEGGDELLENWLGVNPNGRLCVVDILKRVRPRTSPNRNVYDADYEALEAMQRLAGEHGVAILVVHHTRKLGAADPVDEVSGSTGLSGGADGILVLKRDRGRADAYLHVTGREIEEEAELALRWDANLASWSLVGDAEEYRHSNERQQVLQTLRRAETPMSPKEIAEATDKTHGSVKVLLGEMVKASQVSNPSYGKYVLPAANAYSPNSPYPNGEEEGESKESKRSKGTDEGAHERPDSGTVISLRKAPNAHNQSGDSSEEVSAFLEDPPDWYRKQVEECKRQGVPERLVKPLATAVACEVFGNTNRWSELLPRVEATLMREER